MTDLRDGIVTAVQRVATVIPPPSGVFRFPLAEERDPYSDQWRYSHGLLGSEGGVPTASKFPHKDDTQPKGGTDDDLDERPIRQERSAPKDRTEFDLDGEENAPPPAPSGSSGG
eukprot:535940-Amphidinium_carterae.1